MSLNHFIKTAIREGHHGAVFAYGKTATGKTHTMIGNRSALNGIDVNNEYGIIPLAIRDCFKFLQQREDSRAMSMHVSYLEIYNEECHDLLSNTKGVGKDSYISSALKRKIHNSSCISRCNPDTQDHDKHDCNSCNSIDIFETTDGTIIRGLTEVSIFNMNEALDILSLGEIKRQIGCTEANSQSSRSHSIFRIVVSYAGDIYCTLSLVDLAGSESVKRTNSSGKRLSEGNFINKSLTTLGVIIRKLSEASNRDTSDIDHIPYRDSKLTRILKHALSGKAKLTVICTVSSFDMDFNETRNTLNFASRCKAIKQKYTKTEVSLEIQREIIHIKEINLLKGELSQSKAELSREKLLRIQSDTELVSIKSKLERASETYRISPDDLEKLVTTSIVLEKVIPRLSTTSLSFPSSPRVNLNPSSNSQAGENGMVGINDDVSHKLTFVLDQIYKVIDGNKSCIASLTDSVLASCPAYLVKDIIEGRTLKDTIQSTTSKQFVRDFPFAISTEFDQSMSNSNHDSHINQKHCPFHIPLVSLESHNSKVISTEELCINTERTEKAIEDIIYFLPSRSTEFSSKDTSESQFLIYKAALLFLALPIVRELLRSASILCMISQMASHRRRKGLLIDTFNIILKVAFIQVVSGPIFSIGQIICLIVLFKTIFTSDIIISVWIHIYCKISKHILMRAKYGTL